MTQVQAFESFQRKGVSSDLVKKIAANVQCFQTGNLSQNVSRNILSVERKGEKE